MKLECISISALEQYLYKLDAYIEKSGKLDKQQSDAQLALFRAELERNLAYYKAVQEHSIEVLRSVFSFAQVALKSSMLINGGAAAGLLAFIGKIWNQSIPQEASSSLTLSILLFSFGVLASALGTVFSYFTQYSYTREWSKWAGFFHIFTVFLVIGSFMLFGIATYKAYLTFAIHLSQVG